MLIGVGALVALFGLFFFLGWRAKSRNTAALNWPSVDGEIVRSEVQSKWTTDGQGQAVYRHRPIIAYAYSVGGQAYSGKRIDFYGNPGYTEAKARALCDKFPSGARVPIYYNPSNPKDAVLERITPKS